MRLSDILNDFNPLMEGDKRDKIKTKQQKYPISQEIKPKFLVKIIFTPKYMKNFEKILGKYPSEEGKQDIIYTIK